MRNCSAAPASKSSPARRSSGSRFAALMRIPKAKNLVDNSAARGFANAQSAVEAGPCPRWALSPAVDENDLPRRHAPRNRACFVEAVTGKTQRASDFTIDAPSPMSMVPWRTAM